MLPNVLKRTYENCWSVYDSPTLDTEQPKRSHRPWREIAQELARENNHARIRELREELSNAMDEQEFQSKD